MNQYDILIVGGGAAGMSAAISGYHAGCRRILLVDQRPILGGILPQCVHHGFGLTTFGQELTGPEYAEHMIHQLLKTNIEILLDTDVISISTNKTAVLSSYGRLCQVAFNQLILATGCREIPIGALPISGTRPAGIFTAGQAQELINLHHQTPGNGVLILGSGDLGMIMARRFAAEGRQVIAVVEKADHYSGLPRNYHRCIEAYSIPLICSATVTEIFGEERIAGVTLTHLNTGAEEYIPCDTLITAVGLIPDQTLVHGIENSDWLHFCGNCNRVHGIVDSAVTEASAVGIKAYEKTL